MISREYLDRRALEGKVDYEWTRRIANKLQAVPGEDYPKLWDALEELSLRAAYSLGVACSEWVAARFQHLSNVADLELRIEAAWAATIDWRYANPSEPDAPDSGPNPDPVAEPLWLAALFLFDLQNFYVKTYEGEKNQGIRATALRLILLARQVVPKRAGFDKWLTASMRKAKAQFPATKLPIQKEGSVPPDFFEAAANGSDAAAVSQANVLASLNPARNPYLRKPAQMKADGFKGDPYPAAKRK